MDTRLLTALPQLPQHCAAYLVDLSQSALQVDHAWAVLDSSERLRANSFRQPDRRRQYIQCHATLREILSRHTGVASASIEFQLGNYGKPVLSGLAAENGITFNLSHSGVFAVIAVAKNQAVGVDIEQVKTQRDLLNIAKHCFAESEYLAINRLTSTWRIDAFYTCWSRKESFVKATGLGLSMPLDKFAVNVSPDASARLIAIDSDDDSTANWQMHTLLTPVGYFGALTLGKINRQAPAVCGC